MSEATLKTVNVSEKGQIVIPREISLVLACQELQIQKVSYSQYKIQQDIYFRKDIGY